VDEFEVSLSEQARSALTFQQYAPAPRIEGVQLRRLPRHHSENGWFMEYLRLDGGAARGGDGAPALQVRQISLSSAEPHRVNAFHIHPRVEQNELWCVVKGQLLVWLADCRTGSRSEGVRQKVVLHGEDPALLYIPAGVAHGYRSGSEGALLLYAMDQQFDPADPNEGRLPWDHFGADLWDEDRG
jgi:dTDP-4-dehydrorhamnose 3,5-epimerase